MFDRIAKTIMRAKEITNEMGRNGASVDMAFVFATIVESFRRNLDAAARADFDQRVRLYATLFDSADRVAKGELTIEQAAAVVKKEVA